MKKVFGIIFGVLFGILLIGEIIYNSVWALLDQNGQETITIHEACEIGEVKHTINFIPVGKDYYYFGVNDETGEAYVILASKNWCKDNFSDDCRSLDPDGYELQCRVKKISDSQTRKNISDYLKMNYGGVIGLTYPEGMERCLNETYKRIALLKLIELISLVCSVVTAVIMARKGEEAGKGIKIAFGICAGVFACILLYTVLRL